MAEKFAAISGPGRLQAAEIGEGNTSGEVHVPRIAGQQRATTFIPACDNEGGGCAARQAQCPLRIGRDRQLAWPFRMVCQGETRDPDRVIQRHEMDQVEADTVSLVFETAIAESVAGHVTPLITYRHCRCRPYCQALFIAHVDRIAAGVHHRIVRPGRERILAAVVGPCIACAFRRYLKTEAGVGDDIEPGSRRAAAGLQDRHILLALLVKAPETIEELQRRQHVFVLRCFVLRCFVLRCFALQRLHCCRLRLVRRLGHRVGHLPGRRITQCRRYQSELVGNGSTVRHQHHPRHGLQQQT